MCKHQYVYNACTPAYYQSKGINCLLFTSHTAFPEDSFPDAPLQTYIGHLVPPNELHWGVWHPQGFRHPLQTLGIWYPQMNFTGEYGTPRDLGIPCKHWASGTPSKLHWGITRGFTWSTATQSSCACNYHIISEVTRFQCTKTMCADIHK